MTWSAAVCRCEAPNSGIYVLRKSNVTAACWCGAEKASNIVYFFFFFHVTHNADSTVLGKIPESKMSESVTSPSANSSEYLTSPSSFIIALESGLESESEFEYPNSSINFKKSYFCGHIKLLSYSTNA